MSGYTVIGAGGFVGSRVLACLKAEGLEVYAPERGDPELWRRNLGRVFYCAGLTGDYRQRPFAAVEAHVSLVAGLLQDARFDRLVYLSSTRLYDALPDGEGREDRAIPLDPANPRFVYELSKALGENLTLNQSQGRGAVARLSYVFDWSNRAEGFLSDWLRRAVKARSLTVDSSPVNGRDYIHLDDVVVALRAIVDSMTTEIVNVASGTTLSNAQIAEVFAAHGWSVAFTQPSIAGPVRRCNVERLAALGAPARDVRALIDSYLAGLAAH